MTTVELTSGEELSRLELFTRVTSILVKHGFHANQTGYRYLREAVCLVYEDPERITCVTKLLYPDVAKIFESTGKQVERAIRNSIETAYAKGDLKQLQELFKDCKEKGIRRPTNTEAVKVILEYAVVYQLPDFRRKQA